MRNETQMIEQIRTEGKDKPAITSLLDLDHYKLTMGQFVFDRYPDVPVKYTFKNRTNIRLADVIPEKTLRNELDAIRELKATPIELNYLRTLKNNGKKLFNEDYLNFLGKVKLPDYNLNIKDGNFDIEFPGKWKEAIYWETLTLSVMNELYYRNLTKNFDKDQMDNLYQTGKQRLDQKIRTLNEFPDIKYLEFGTRRRFSKTWQDYVVKTLKEKKWMIHISCPQGIFSWER